MAKRLFEIAAEIVQAQISTSQLSTEEIVSSLKQVFKALREMQRSESEGGEILEVQPLEETGLEKTVERLNPQNSIQEDKVICLECGAQMRQLTAKHLSSHGMNIREYKKKWGFSIRQSMSAMSLSRIRSIAAKRRGLPQQLLKYQAQKKKSKETSSVAAVAYTSEVVADEK